MAELIDQLKAATDHASDSIGALTTASDAAKKAATDAIQAMRDQVATYAKQVTDAQASWIAQSKKINDDAANQLASLKTKDQNEIATIVKSIADQRDAAISDLNKKAHDQLGSIQSDYSNWKNKTVADFNSTVDSIKKSIEQNNDTLTQVNKSVAEVKKEFDSVDFAKFVTGDTIKNYYTKEETDLRLAQAGKVKSVNGNLPDQDGDVHVPSYAPNLLLGTQSKPKTVEMVNWSANADTYSIDPSIDLSGQTVTASIKFAKSANDTNVILQYADSTGTWHYPWGNVIPAGTTGYSTVTQVLPANVKNIAVRPSWTTGTAKGTCTYSEAKLAVWKSAGLPPDMTWVPNEADKADKSDVTVLQGKIASQGTEITKKADKSDVTAYAPNLLLGTQSKPKTVEMVNWSANADTYSIDPSIDLSGQTVTASIKFAKSANDAMVALQYTDSTGAWHFPTGNVIPAGNTGYSTVTQVLPANVKNIGVRPSWTNGNTKGTCTYSEAKLAVWKSASLPPDMTWLPNEADKADKSDVTVLQEKIASQGTEITKKADKSDVTAYAPNLLLGTQSKPKTVEMVNWSANADQYSIDPSIDLSGQKVTASIKLAKSANDAMVVLQYTDSTGAWHFPTGNVIPAGNTGYSTLTQVLPANVKNIGVRPSWTTGTAKGTCTYSEAKLAVWKSAGLPPDMTWVPNEADKADKSDVTTLQGEIAAIETGYMKKPTVISKADYDKLPTKDPNTLYEITE
ncbi:hypothetical protein [Lactobacillus phage CV244]|nr:hypothetical protein [Lactobacillus phage CV244]